jgi:hypothetical protein
MSHSYKVKMRIAGAGLSAGAALAGLGLSSGVAQANPYTWCPGMPMLGITGPDRGGPGLGVDWDMTRCHTWWGVRHGMGNVAPSVWDGPDPPPPEAEQPGPCGPPFMCSGTP